MPGVPSREVIDQRYYDGVMKYDAWIEYISSNESIPIQYLHATPQLTLEEFRGQNKKNENGTENTKKKDTFGKPPTAKKKTKTKRKRQRKHRKRNHFYNVVLYWLY
jgi:hypothetical protein